MRTSSRFVASTSAMAACALMGGFPARLAAGVAAFDSVALALPVALTQKTENGSVQRGERRISYKRVSAEGSLGRVVLVAGAGSSLASFDEVASDLVRAGLEVFLVDPSGRGLSSKHGQADGLVHAASISDLADDVGAFLDAIPHASAEAPVALFGEGSGAVIATLEALRRPERVSHLALVNPLLEVPIGTLSISAADFAYLSGQVLLGHALRPLLTDAIGSAAWAVPAERSALTSSEARRQAVLRSLRENPAGSQRGVTILWARALADASFRLESEAYRLRMPVIVLRGGDDTLANPLPQDELCKRMAACRKVTIAGARHKLLFENDAARDEALGHLFRFVGSHPLANARGIAQGTTKKAL